MAGQERREQRTRVAAVVRPSVLFATLWRAREVLLLFLAVDIALICFHALHSFTPHLSDFYSNITYERGAAETVQFLKGSWIVLALFWLAVSNARAYLAWVLFFGYVLADDSLQLHEQAGDPVATLLGFTDSFGLRSVDFGELAYFAVIGSVVFPFLVIAYWIGGAAFRTASRHLFLLVALLAVFSMVLDPIHGGTNDEFGHHPLALLEEGGELLMTTVLCAFVLGLLRNVMDRGDADPGSQIDH